MTIAPTTTNRFDDMAAVLMRAGELASRYGLVVVLAWIGFGKYVKMEARVLIEHSPLMSWIYDYLSVTTVARGLGTMEIVAALLIALRPVSPRASAIGSALAVVVHGYIELLVHYAGGGRHPRCRRTCAHCTAGSIPSQRLGAHGRGDMDFGRLASRCDALARRQRVRLISVCIALAPRSGGPRASRRPRGVSPRLIRSPASQLLLITPGQRQPVVGADRVLVVQFGLVDNEYLDGARTPRARRRAGGDVPLGGETGLARGTFSYPPHDVNQSVATTAGLGPYGGQAQWQRRDAVRGDVEGSGVEPLQFGGARRVI